MEPEDPDSWPKQLLRDMALVDFIWASFCGFLDLGKNYGLGKNLDIHSALGVHHPDGGVGHRAHDLPGTVAEKPDQQS